MSDNTNKINALQMSIPYITSGLFLFSFGRTKTRVYVCVYIMLFVGGMYCTVGVNIHS